MPAGGLGNSPGPRAPGKKLREGSGVNESREILGIIRQLMDYTEQLAHCEGYPEMDIEALTRASRDRMAELERLTVRHDPGSGEIVAGSAGALFEENPEIPELLRKLEISTRQSIKALERCRNGIEAKLSPLRRSEQALKAYNRFPK